MLEAKQAGYTDAKVEIIENLGMVTTGEAKAIEAQYVRQARSEGHVLPLNKEKDTKYHP